MKNKIKYWALALALPFAFVSCDDFLDQDPDNRVYLDNPEFIEKLLVSAYPEADFTSAFSSIFKYPSSEKYQIAYC